MMSYETTRRSAVRAAAIATFAIGLQTAHGGYIISPVSSGAGEVWINSYGSEVERTFNLDIMLSRDASETHLSSEFRLLFSDPGLELLSYEWGAGYTTGGLDDVSVPAFDDVPTVIDQATYAPTPEVDLYFSNLTDDGSIFGEGTLLTLTLMVPGDWIAAPHDVEIAAMPELFFDGFGAVPTVSGSSFALHVIPTPGSLCLLLLAATRCRRRR